MKDLQPQFFLLGFAGLQLGIIHLRAVFGTNRPKLIRIFQRICMLKAMEFEDDIIKN